MVLDVIFWEELVEDVAGLGIGDGALFDKLVATLGVGVGDVAGDGVNCFALSEGTGGGVERAGLFGGFDYDYDIGEAGDDPVAVEKADFGL